MFLENDGGRFRMFLVDFAIGSRDGCHKSIDVGHGLSFFPFGVIEQLPPQAPEAFLGGLRSLFHFGLSEVFRLEDLADFDIRRARHRVRAALDPLNRLID